MRSVRPGANRDIRNLSFSQHSCCVELVFSLESSNLKTVLLGPMTYTKLRLSIFTTLLLCCTSAFAQWDAPPDYYSNATGSGATLKAQLTAAMSVGHIQQRYGDFRDSAAIHDQDPSNSSNIVLVYNGLSVNAQWDSGSTWNREHVWPQSRQPGSASNSTRGNLGDPHALRPSTPGVNSSRSNRPFGFGSTTGIFGSLGTYYFVGDVCRGDIARSLFYSDTRWTNLGISLVNGIPSGNQMGDLASLIEWHYLDPPDEFERRRNHTIFSSQFNPQFYTNNRNAYIDRPEYVWSIYVDQMNDSTITIAGSSAQNGSSFLQIDYGAVIVGTNISTSETITLNKAGNDGTYYSVESVGNALSDVEGFSNAFKMNGTDNRSVNVSLAYDQMAAGVYDGMIMVDNLDITTQGGVGNGANDGNDFVDLTLKVVEHSNASFDDAADLNVLTVDLGEVSLGQPIPPVDLSIFNLESQAGSQLTACLDLISVDTIPQSSFLTFSGSLFEDLPADDFIESSIEGTPEDLGAGSTEFVFHLSDQDIPGAEQQTLRLIVNYDVVAASVLHGDINMDGVVNFQDIAPFIGLLSTDTYLEAADCNFDGVVNFLDIAPFIGIFPST